MSTVIYYFSGTGNSLRIANQIAEQIPDTSVVAISFPVYCWGMPAIVAEFIKKLSVDKKKYYFSVVTCGSSIGATLLDVDKALTKRGAKLAAGFKVVMPGNYIPMYGARSKEAQNKIFAKSITRVQEIVVTVKNKEVKPIEKGFFLFNLLSNLLYKSFLPQLKKADSKYWVDQKCTGCGICFKVCPVNNIELIENKPTWKHNCEQCMACLQWCPTAAIQCGKKTTHRKRYQHPDIKIQDLIY